MKPKTSISYNVALSGIVAALGIFLMFLVGFIPIGQYIFPAIAGMLIWVVKSQINTKWAFMCYGATAILALIVTPDIEAKAMFVMFFGYYPIVRSLIHEKFKHFVTRWGLKLALFNVTTIITYYFLFNVLGMAELVKEMQEYGKYSMLILLALGNLSLICMDFCMEILFEAYEKLLKPKLARR